MATSNKEREDTYAKLERIVMEKVLTLELENAQLKNQLAIAQAKLDVYERIATISNSKTTLGFGPIIQRDEDCR